MTTRRGNPPGMELKKKNKEKEKEKEKKEGLLPVPTTLVTIGAVRAAVPLAAVVATPMVPKGRGWSAVGAAAVGVSGKVTGSHHRQPGVAGEGRAEERSGESPRMRGS